MDNAASDLDSLPAPNAADLVSEPAPAWAVTLTKAQIKAICLFACDESRPNLNQVWFQGGRMFATDGHRLAIVGPDLNRGTCSVKHTAGFGISSNALGDFSKSMRVGDVLTITDSGCTLTRKDGSVARVDSLLSMCDDKCKFPQAAQVVPWGNIADTHNTANRGCPWINASYLTDATQVATLVGYTRVDPVHHIRCIAGDDDLDPMVTFARRTDDDIGIEIMAIVVTMPMNRC